VTERAHAVAAAVLGEGELAVDATAGNGHDTVFLAGRVGAGGRVLAFDVQREAIDSARRRVGAAGFGDRVRWFGESHARIAERVGGAGVKAVMFNLGYLPGGDRGVITTVGEPLAGLEAARRVLVPGGVIAVVCYTGHAGGEEEAVKVVEWAGSCGGEVGEPARAGAPFLVVVRG